MNCLINKSAEWRGSVVEQSYRVASEMSIFTKETSWTDSTKSIVITLPLRGKLRKDIDILQTKTYLKVSWDIFLRNLFHMTMYYHYSRCRIHRFSMSWFSKTQFCLTETWFSPTATSSLSWRKRVKRAGKTWEGILPKRSPKFTGNNLKNHEKFENILVFINQETGGGRFPGVL